MRSLGPRVNWQWVRFNLYAGAGLCAWLDAKRGAT